MKHRRFVKLVNALILANVAVIASYTTDMPPGTKDALDRTNLGFNCFFALELLVRVVSDGRDFFLEAVNSFDAFVVLVALFADVFIAVAPSGAVRALRTLRLVRLFYSSPAFHVLFDVFFRSLPILLNIFGLTALVFFMYAVLGMNLFGAVNANQENLNRQANFSSFGVAMLLLLRVATGDDWTAIMHEAMVRVWAGGGPCTAVLASSASTCAAAPRRRI